LLQAKEEEHQETLPALEGLLPIILQQLHMLEKRMGSKPSGLFVAMNCG
jgi:hypothetical protein